MKKIDNSIYNKRWAVLLITITLTLMATLDSSIVNVALPVMSHKLSVSMASIEWVVTSYLIVIVGSLLIFGRLADLKGKTNIFKVGIVIFTLGSLTCGLSNSLVPLVISRIIQAIGAAGTMSTSHGIITTTFPQNERGKALGLNGSFVALGSMIGPPLGGLIVSSLSWQYIFLINVPIGIIAFIAAVRIFPKSEVKVNESLDVKGAVLFTLTIVLLFGALTRGQEIGYSKAIIIGAFLASIISLMLFIYLEKRLAAPLLDLDIFKNSLFSLSLFCAFISFVAISCSNIILPFYLQYVHKLTAAQSGILMTVSPLILGIVSPLSGHISDKIGSEILTFIGLVVCSIGLFLIATLNQYSLVGYLIIFLAITTIGNGIFQSPNNSLVMSTAPKNKLGIAGSINALVRNLGMIFGVSLSTTILYNRMSYKIGYHVTGYINGRDDIFVYGMSRVYIVAGIISGIGALLTAYRLYKIKSSKPDEHSKVA